MVGTSEQEWKELKRKEKLLRQAAEILRVEKKDVPRVIRRFLDEMEEMDKQLMKQ